KFLTRRSAFMPAASLNLLGALSGTAVAKTAGAGLVDTTYVTSMTILAAMFAGISWNLFTWWSGLPTSSSHALIGGLCGAALASTSAHWDVIKWSIHKIDAHGKASWDGLFA